MTVTYYMVSTHEKSPKVSPANMWWQGFVSEEMMRAKRKGYSAVVLFSVLKPGGGRSNVVDPYTIALGPETKYDAVNGMQIVGPKDFERMVNNFDEFVPGDLKKYCRMVLDRPNGRLIVSHTDAPQSVERASGHAEINRGTVQAALVACSHFGLNARKAVLSWPAPSL